MSTQKKPLVFLDWDGVVCPMCAGTKEEMVRHYDSMPGTERMRFSPSCGEQLKRLVETADAEIVISSTMRLLTDGNTFQFLLGRMDVDPSRLIGQTPFLPASTRDQEISQWIEKNDAQARPFLCLEDREEMGDLEAQTIRTNSYAGLTAADVDKALALLGENR